MEFDKSKLLTGYDKDEARRGVYYYFFDDLQDFINRVADNSLERTNTTEQMKEMIYVGTIADIDDTNGYINTSYGVRPHIDASITYFNFIYPLGVKEKQYLSYEELKERWIKNPCELYCYKNIIGMFTDFQDESKIATFGSLCFTEDKKHDNDDFIFKNLTDINGNPLLKE